MKAILSIEREEARVVIEGLITYIREFERELVNKGKFSKAPIAVTVVNPNGAEPRQDVMDGAVPVASNGLAYQRAAEAISNRSDRTFNEDSFSSFKEKNLRWGSVVLRVHGRTIGAVGVSGRNKRRTDDGYRQDQELAELGADIFKVYSGYSKKIKEEESRDSLIREILEEIVQ